MNLAFSFCVLVLHSRAQSGNLWLRTCVRVSVATEGNLSQLGFKFSAPGATKKIAKIQRCKGANPKKLNKLHFFFIFSTLHLCTLQIFTIYFDCSESVGCENSHDLPLRNMEERCMDIF